MFVFGKLCLDFVAFLWGQCPHKFTSRFADRFCDECQCLSSQNQLRKPHPPPSTPVRDPGVIISTKNSPSLWWMSMPSITKIILVKQLDLWWWKWFLEKETAHFEKHSMCVLRWFYIKKKRVWFCDECHQHPSQNLPGFFLQKKQIGFCDECHQHPSQKLPSFFKKKKRVWFCNECHQHPSQKLPSFF